MHQVELSVVEHIGELVPPPSHTHSNPEVFGTRACVLVETDIAVIGNTLTKFRAT